MYRIELISRDRGLAREVRAALKDGGATVRRTDPAAPPRGAPAEAPDLCILDCRASVGTAERAWAAWSAVPLIAIFDPAQVAEPPAATVYDDFIVTPIDGVELARRVTRLLDPDPRIWAAGALRVDPVHRAVTVQGRRVGLTFKEYELLCLLMQHMGTPLTRGMLLRRIWGREKPRGERTIDVHIRRLRNKLGAKSARSIETVPHVGYRFLGAPILARGDERARRANGASIAEA